MADECDDEHNVWATASDAVRGRLPNLKEDELENLVLRLTYATGLLFDAIARDHIAKQFPGRRLSSEADFLLSADFSNDCAAALIHAADKAAAKITAEHLE